ncbi:DUF2147 domain-containing protein [Ohtaekwangia koreensis]|uniref:Lipocalin-like domain-containing protein n=1 Tax=Ohtaekwangia koreensis TaxID=688867 RepID=A0A1T5IMS7_9BACT|nr:hypothetical protein [Ohtaekwangia koreensis]SKC40435.1 hypothetical protein SAMN05660236_0186 [Ohtaekwangia koreensis]
MKSPIILFMLMFALCSIHGMGRAQSIVGKWQLVKQTSCLEDDVDASDDNTGMQEVADEMKSMSGAIPQVIQFKEKNMAEESTKIVSRRKSYNSKSFMYKFNSDALHFLDKKSHTILESFTVEKFSADSLIISNASRVCETKIFVRIK